MGKEAKKVQRSPMVRFLATQGPILALLLLLAVFALGTFGNYVASDDLNWVTRAISDSTRPWRLFSTDNPLFGNYYRPMPQLAWLINYYFWGFNFAGHQAMFILLWLAVVWLVYQVGLRIAGRTAAFIAAALVGCNDIYLMISSWKSWYTTLIELAAVLAWAVFYLDWLNSRTRARAIGWVICAIVAVLSRELAPLVISAAIMFTLVLPALFGKEWSWKRKTALAAAWLLVTAAVLAALPSYREGLRALLHGGPGSAGGISWANVGQRFWTHTGSIFFNGISRYLLYLAALPLALNCLRRWAGRTDPRGQRVAFLGALMIGCVLLAIPANANAALLGPRAWEVVKSFVLPLSHGLLLALVIFSAFTGDRIDRMLGAWFLAAFPPILFLAHSSNAYHMMAFVPLALFAGKQAAALIQECWKRLKLGRHDTMGPESSYALCVVLALILVGQGVMLARDVGSTGDESARKKIRTDVEMGRRMSAMVDRTIVAVVSNVPIENGILVADDPYSLLAAQVLKVNYGFAVSPLEKPGMQMVGLRLFDAPLHLYSHAVEYDDALFQRYNHPLLRPDSSFESLPLGGAVVEGGRTGRNAMAATAHGAESVRADLPSTEFSLPAGAYVFGGFLKVKAEKAEGAAMTLVEQGAASDPLIRRTPLAAQDSTEWQLLWEDAAIPQAGRFVLRILDVDKLRNGDVLVDDIFLCPAAALIAEQQRREKPVPEAPAVTEPATEPQP